MLASQYPWYVNSLCGLGIVFLVATKAGLVGLCEHIASYVELSKTIEVGFIFFWLLGPGIGGVRFITVGSALLAQSICLEGK